MSKGYYRVDAVAPDGKAGDSRFVRGSNVADAERVFRASFPEVSDWDLTATRIKREDFPMDTEPEVLILPPASEVLPGVHVADLEEDYNAWSAEFVRARLLEKRAAGEVSPRVLVQSPTDTIEEGNDSRDLVTLGRKGEVVVIDKGVR